MQAWKWLPTDVNWKSFIILLRLAHNTFRLFLLFPYVFTTHLKIHFLILLNSSVQCVWDGSHRHILRSCLSKVDIKRWLHLGTRKYRPVGAIGCSPWLCLKTLLTRSRQSWAINVMSMDSINDLMQSWKLCCWRTKRSMSACSGDKKL